MNDRPGYKFLVLRGPPVSLPEAGHSHWRIGRGADNDLVLPDSTVSRRHARIDWCPSPVITDLCSAAGIHVNGASIDRAPLEPGDRVRIGPWEFTLSQAAIDDREVTIERESTLTALAAPRLDLLMTFANRINTSDTEQDVFQTLVSTALAGSGYQRAVLVDVQCHDPKVLASYPDGLDAGHASRQLIEGALDGEVMVLRAIDRQAYSESIVSRRITSATAVVLKGDSGNIACLYLDARAGESSEQPDTPRFCQTLARMAALAIERLRHQHQLWQQREQIYADLHDDLGARLLNLIHTHGDPAVTEKARAMLNDLRDVVSQPDGTGRHLFELLAQARAEARQRIMAAGIALTWTQAPEVRNPVWSQRACALLSRCLRESLSNAIGHAGPGHVEVTIDMADDWLDIRIRHDGSFHDPSGWRPGRGTNSLKKRCAELGGRVEWQVSGRQLQTRLSLPVEPAL